MSVARRQRTLARPVSVTGFGYFSGRDVRVEFWPAAENAGITFVRHDIGRAARMPADVGAAHRRAAPHDARARTAFASKWSSTCWPRWPGCGVDNCEVWVDAPEMPGCDGSSRGVCRSDRRGRRRRAAQPRAADRGRPDRCASATTTVGSKPSRRAAPACRSRSNWISATADGDRPADCSRSTSRPIRSAANWRPAARSFRRKRPKACCRRASASASRRATC